MEKPCGKPPHRSGEPSVSESAAESGEPSVSESAAPRRTERERERRRKRGGRGAATAKNRAHRKRRGRRTQNRAAHRLPPWNCAAPHFCLFVRNFANRRRKKFRRYRFTAQTAAPPRTERERELRRNATAGARRPQKAAPPKKARTPNTKPSRPPLTAMELRRPALLPLCA